MIDVTLYNFFIYILLTWGSNISLNFLYIIKKKYPILNIKDIPLDMNFNLGNNRILGESTTFLGLIISILLSLLLYISSYFYFVNLFMIPILVYFGHAFGSFIKRRLGKRDGNFMLFVDHGDYMIFTGLSLFFVGIISLDMVFWSLLFTYLFHPIACIIAFNLKLKERPY